MNVEIIELPDDAIASVAALFGEVFGHPMSLSQWRWKYHEGPRLGHVNVAARTAEGHWVGHAGALVFPGAYRGRPMPIAQICDVMVDRSARGGLSREGVYPRLMVALRDALHDRFPGVYAFGFPGERPYRLGARVGAYRQLTRCRETTIPAGAPRDLRSAGWSARAFDWQSDDPMLLDRAWSTWAPAQPAPMVERSARWLAWRYRDHPVQRYRFWLLRRWGRQAGWVVTRPLSEETVCLVDALLPSLGHAAYACAAVRAAEARSAGRRIALQTWLPLPGGVDTPIVAIEFLVDRWRTDLPIPLFQPGDTDVY